MKNAREQHITKMAWIVSVSLEECYPKRGQLTPILPSENRFFAYHPKTEENVWGPVRSEWQLYRRYLQVGIPP